VKNTSHLPRPSSLPPSLPPFLQPLLDGKNMLLQAQSGHGKTAIFATAILNSIDTSKEGGREGGRKGRGGRQYDIRSCSLKILILSSPPSLPSFLLQACPTRKRFRPSCWCPTVTSPGR